MHFVMQVAKSASVRRMGFIAVPCTYNERVYRMGGLDE